MTEEQLRTQVEQATAFLGLTFNNNFFMLVVLPNTDADEAKLIFTRTNGSRESIREIAELVIEKYKQKLVTFVNDQ